MFTTYLPQKWPIYPNLTRRVLYRAQPAVGGRHYVHPTTERFIYLAVLLDAYSRRVIGWDLGRTLHAELAIRALQMALSERNWKAEELIHHSDQGVQYAQAITPRYWTRRRFKSA